MYSVRLSNRRVYPSKIVCVGRNYIEHIKELENVVPEEMVVFHKPNTSISPVLRCFHQETLHYETEIAFLIRKGKLHAVGLGLDLTKRHLQATLKKKGLPWERAKAFDGSAVFSRFVSLKSIEIESLHLELLINCVRVQSGGVAQMIYSPETILNDIRSYTTLCDNDIIMTGTPQGVGEIHQGDVFLARLKSGAKTLVEIEWLAQ